MGTMRPRQKRTPFCSREVLESYKRMKVRELQRQGKPIPSTLLPTEQEESSLQRENEADQQLPF